MQVVGLFAGIGGIELGLAKAGHRTVLLCENDPFAGAVLDARFPDLPRTEDVRALEGPGELLHYSCGNRDSYRRGSAFRCLHVFASKA